jgi:hypothetical protein
MTEQSEIKYNFPGSRKFETPATENLTYTCGCPNIIVISAKIKLFQRERYSCSLIFQPVVASGELLPIG